MASLPDGVAAIPAGLPGSKGWGHRSTPASSSERTQMPEVIRPIVHVVVVLWCLLIIAAGLMWLERRAARALAGPVRTEPGGAVRAAPGAGRHGQDALQGRLDPALRR